MLQLAQCASFLEVLFGTGMEGNRNALHGVVDIQLAALGVSGLHFGLVLKQRLGQVVDQVLREVVGHDEGGLDGHGGGGFGHAGIGVGRDIIGGVEGIFFDERGSLFAVDIEHHDVVGGGKARDGGGGGAGGAEEGVYSYIDKIGAELNDTMKMCGVSRLSEITRDCVRR